MKNWKKAKEKIILVKFAPKRSAPKLPATKRAMPKRATP